MCLVGFWVHKEAVWSVVVVCALQVIWYGQSGKNCQTPVPHIEHRAHWLSEVDFECVQVLSGNGVVEGQRSGVIVQQHSKTTQVG